MTMSTLRAVANQARGLPSRFGLTARTVLSHWGVSRTQDLGDIVYHLIDVGLLVSQPQDRLEDFDDVFDFAEAFERGYPWSGLQGNGGRR